VEPQSCPACGEINPADARLCGMCGASLRADEAAGVVRREVTIVTSDLKGSTALGERLDPEALREVLNRYFDVMRAVFESHGGTIEKIIGDAIVAVYGLPFRHEDDPLRAVEAAAESQRAMATLNEELDRGWNVQLTVRTGVATGEVSFGKAEAGQHVLLGGPAEVATVMEQNAPSFEVLLDDATRRLVGDHVDVEDFGLVSPKGSEETFPSYRLVAVHERATEGEAIVPEVLPGMRICPGCGEQNPERMRFCTVCGASLSQVVARESRRTVTIVFAMPKVHSVSGEAVGPETLRDVMSRYFDGMREALERHGGTVEKFIGDAVMAVFGLPVRHEDDAVRAIRAAADMQAALERLNPEFRAGYSLELSNHIGVNSGEVIAGDASTAQRMVTGDAVNTAARLEQAAGPGQIVLGDLTYRLARDQIDIEFMEPLNLKGKAEPVPAYRLVRMKTQAAAERSHGTPFVGREAEMARLAGGLADATASRGARLVTVVGDAGVGKSRLIREFASAAEERARIVRGRCLPYGEGITFWPLAEVVREAAGITSEDSPRVATRRIERLLERAAVEDREDVVERVAAAINLNAAQFPVAELMWGGRRLLETLAAERPLVVIVDDLHWAESTFLEFLDHLIESVENASVLVLGTARHEIAERHADWSAAHEPMLVMLEPLSEADSGRIVEELLGSLEPSVRNRIALAAEGNPLYVEQIVSMLVETGAIERGAEGWIAKAGARELQIPPTVQALVAARLDALHPEERAVVDPGSVIGLTFALDAVTDLVDEGVRPRLGSDLDVLVGKQLVRRLPDEEILYRFGHQIIRDTAYGSLLKRIRATLHERFVAWAERVNRERGRELEFEEILGYHLEQAYRYRTELGVIDEHARSIADRAATKLSSAGRRALARSDMPAAASLLARAMSLLSELDPRRIELLLDLSEVKIELGELEAAAVAVGEARGAAAQLGDPRLLARTTLSRIFLRNYAPSIMPGDGEDDADLLRAAMDSLEQADDHSGLARAWRVHAVLSSRAGRYDDVSRAAEQLIEHAIAAGEERLVARGASGYANQAVWSSQPVAELTTRIQALVDKVHGDRKAEATIALSLAQLRAMEGEFDLARELYRRGQTLLRDLGPSVSAITTSIASAYVEALAGDLEAAEAELRRDEAALAELDERFYRSSIAGTLARVLLRAGKVDEANRFARLAQDIADPEDTDPQVLWRSVQSRILAIRGELDEAARLSGEAVELAGETEDIILKADALVDRSVVLAAAGEADAAGAALETAIRLYEQKGDVISADRIRRELSVAAART
jgi:class 3 adenylate cyclase/tetratricopeptide (TPR) repeat protein